MKIKSIKLMSMLACGTLAMSPYIAHATGVVISQIYGGNGSVYARDYVELFNASTGPVDINGWSLQYSSATGTGLFSGNGVTPLAGVLQPGQYHLVGLATATNGIALPAVNSTGMTNLSAANGKVVLVSTSAGLACNGGSTPCTPSQTAQIVDLVGYGTSNYHETAAAPALTTSTALLRASGGCSDTNNNSADFISGAPAPRNSASPISTCGTVGNTPIVPICDNLTLENGTGGSLHLSASDADSIVNAAEVISSVVQGISLGGFVSAANAGGVASATLNVDATVPSGVYPLQVRFSNDAAQSAVCTPTITVTAPTPVTPIPSIQGNGSASPMAGMTVTTQGVVTAKFNHGFYLQDSEGDGDLTTSDGIFVYLGAPLTAANVGDLVKLSAKVAEYNGLTELTGPSNLITLTTGQTITPQRVSLPETSNGELERYEGMLIAIDTPMTVSQNYFQGRYGQVTLSSGGRLTKPTNVYPAGSPEALALADENARRILILDDGSSQQNPNPIPYIGENNTLRAGDTVTGLVGVLDYGLITASSTGPYDYKLNPVQPPVISRDNPRTAYPEAVGGNVKVASFNVLNYFTTFTNGTNAFGASGQGCTLGGSTSASNCRGADNAQEFARQRDKIIHAITAIGADVVGLMEIQNNGATAVQNLVDGLNTKLGSTVYARVPDPVTGTGTDAIKVALIYKPATLALHGSSLSDTDSINSRPTLAQTFAAANGERFSVIVNHLKSKGCGSAAGGDLDQGDGQGCYNAQRLAQAERLSAHFIPQVVNTAGDPDVLVIGDMNAYGKEDPILLLEHAGLEDQIARFNDDRGYSYVFDGESGYLDHALASASMSAQITRAVEWHINADEPSVIDYNTEFKPQDLYTALPYRASDHDPVLVGISLMKTLNGSSARDTLNGTPGDDMLYGGAGTDTISSGAGKDLILYRSLTDGIDLITDFQPGADRLVLTPMLQAAGIVSSDPIASGHVSCKTGATGAQIGIDVDGAAGSAASRGLVVLKGLGCAAALQTGNLVF